MGVSDFPISTGLAASDTRSLRDSVQRISVSSRACECINGIALSGLKPKDLHIGLGVRVGSGHSSHCDLLAAG
jgi:hypothetical protein